MVRSAEEAFHQRKSRFVIPCETAATVLIAVRLCEGSATKGYRTAALTCRR